MNHDLNHAPLQHLLAPLSPASPAGEDLAYSALFDDIRAARHGDDPSLAQGDWARTLKAPEWPRVVQLCEDALATRSKDLQLAVWLVDARVRWQGFVVLADALGFVADLIDAFWANLHPPLDDGDASERAARLEWLDKQLGESLRALPLAATTHGGHSWYDYDAARDTDNRRRAGSDDVDGPRSDQLDSALTRSGTEWLHTLHAQLGAAMDATQRLDDTLVRHFGAQAPGLARLRAAITDCQTVVARSGIAAAPAAGLVPEHTHSSAGAVDTPAALAGPATSPPPDAPAPPSPTTNFDRNAAVRQLHEVAGYFRRHEPHSPVALLVERAARWAEMSFEEWLQAVIQDGTTLDQLQQLLEFRRAS